MEQKEPLESVRAEEKKTVGVSESIFLSKIIYHFDDESGNCRVGTISHNYDGGMHSH